jgi:lipid A 3-O-deacylase
VLFVSITRKTVRSVYFAAALLWFGIQPSRAVDGFAVTAGKNGPSDMWRIGAQWQWPQRWLQGEHSYLGGFWDLGAGQWRREAAAGQRGQIGEISLTPVFRWQANSQRGAYLEGGIGVHLLSATSLGSKRFSTALQFGEHLGFGYRFGAHGAFDLGYRYQHVSNADIKRPNSGIEFNQISLQYWFD